MSVLLLVFYVICVVLGVWILVDCIVHRRKIDAYLKYGAVFCLGVVVIQAGVLYLSGLPRESGPRVAVFILALFPLLEILVATCVGMDSCAVMGSIDAPLLKRLFRRHGEADRLSPLPYAVWTINTAIAATAFSLVLFWLTSPQLSALLKAWVAKTGAGTEPTLLTAVVCTRHAFFEEIVFRLGIQSFLARQFRLQGRKYWIAIVLTSALWAIGHAGTMDPEWVKLAQIFPIGIALGALFRKYGVESCILAHGIFNLVMLPYAPHLIR